MKTSFIYQCCAFYLSLLSFMSLSIACEKTIEVTEAEQWVITADYACGFAGVISYTKCYEGDVEVSRTNTNGEAIRFIGAYDSEQKCDRALNSDWEKINCLIMQKTDCE